MNASIQQDGNGHGTTSTDISSSLQSGSLNESKSLNILEMMSGARSIEGSNELLPTVVPRIMAFNPVEGSEELLPAGLPRISCLKDINKVIDTLVEWVDDHPIDDYVYTFRNTRMGSPLTSDNVLYMFEHKDMCVAGSAALKHVIDILPTSPYHVFPKTWKNNDIDLFLLGKPFPSRMNTGSDLDIVCSPEKTVEELLLGFDLPACRVAFDFQMNIFISAQAIYSIYERRMNIPIYLKEKETMRIIMDKASNESCKEIKEVLINRFYERVKKYVGRGFGVKWIRTSEIIPWIKILCHYAVNYKRKHH